MLVPLSQRRLSDGFFLSAGPQMNRYFGFTFQEKQLSCLSPSDSLRFRPEASLQRFGPASPPSLVVAVA